jgi:hypothetical protein
MKAVSGLNGPTKTMTIEVAPQTCGHRIPHPRAGEAVQESTCRLQCQDTMLPGEEYWVERHGFPEYNLIFLVEAIARAVNPEYNQRSEDAVDRYNSSVGGGGEGGGAGAGGKGGGKKEAVKRTAATPKTWSRMLVKLTGDHKLQSCPRQGNNVDCCRAGLECLPANVVGLFRAMVAEFSRNGGDVPGARQKRVCVDGGAGEGCKWVSGRPCELQNGV